MSSKSGRLVRFLAVFVVMALASSVVPMMTFGGEPTVENVAAQANIVKVGWLSEIVVWNPLNIEMVEDYVACYLVYSCLVTYDENWEGPVGDLALSWNQTVHPDGTMTTYFNLTHNAYFRNKANPSDTSYRLTSRDVVWTYELIMNTTGGSWDFYLRNVTAITAVDPFTVRIDTDYTKATLIDDLTGIPILPCDIFSKNKQFMRDPIKYSMDPTENIGSGPFYFDSWLRGSWYQFRTAPNYHGTADYPALKTVDIDGVLYTVFSDTSGMVLAMNNLNQDCIVLTGDVNLFKNQLGGPGVYKVAVPEPGICDIAINGIPEDFTTNQWGFGDEFLRDYWVRKAIMMTLDKDYIRESLMFNYSIIADSVVQPGYWHYTPQNQVSFDPAGAKALLEAHGYADIDGDGYLEATADAYPVQMGWKSVGAELSGLRCQAPDTDPSWGNIAFAWAGWARQAGIGFVPSVENEVTMINKAWYKADYDIWVWHWGWGPEPLGAALSVWMTEELTYGGDNCQMPMGPWWYGPSNASASPTGEPYSAFDENFTEALHTLDKSERKLIIDKLQQWIYDSMCENPPYYDVGLYGYTEVRYTGWGDWRTHPGRTVTSDLLWLWFDLEPAANLPPVIDSAPGDQDVLVNEPVTFAFTCHDPEGNPLTVNWSFGDGGVAQNTSNTGTEQPTTFRQTHTYTATTTGLTLEVSAWDGLPNHEIAAVATINVVSAPNLGPQIMSLTNDTAPPAYVGANVIWSCTAKDNESGTSGYGLKFTWDWDDGTYDVHKNTTPVPDNTEYTDTVGHAWDAAGTYSIIVSVWDGYDVETNEQHNVSIYIGYTIIENLPPDAPTISAMPGIEGQAVPCSASSSDPDPDTITFTWDFGNSTYIVTTDTGPGVVISEVEFTWSLPGRYLVTVYVDDGKGHNVSASANATIAAAGEEVPPSIGIVRQYPDPVYEGATFALDITVSDANADTITVTVDFGDGELAVATTAGGTTGAQHVNVTHSFAAAGTHTVTIYADDGMGGDHNVSKTFDVDVVAAPTNQPPEFTLASAYTAYYNQTFSIAPVTIRDPDDDPLTVWYDWGDDSPLSMGDPTGTPPHVASHVYRAIGTLTLNVSANDSQGHNVTKSVSVTVSDANLKPTVVSLVVAPSKAKYLPDETIWFNVTVKDFEGDQLTITIDFGDNSPVETKTVTPAPNTPSEVQTFTHSYADENLAGYTVRVTVKDDQDHSNMTWASITYKVVVEAEKKGGGISTAVLAAIGAVIVIIVLGAVAAVLLRRRKKEGREAPPEGGMEGMAPPPPEPPKPSRCKNPQKPLQVSYFKLGPQQMTARVEQLPVEWFENRRTRAVERLKIIKKKVHVCHRSGGCWRRGS
ncbi:MAG: ABC transporter substrate-binding protein [Thermoplasmata archaeon]